MKIKVANSELIDKYTILLVKTNKGLDVDKELMKLVEPVQKLLKSFPEVEHLMNILECLNAEMWVIEDNKRLAETRKEFDEAFIRNARLIYMINDQRARTKRYIDTITNSSIDEKKQHHDY